MSPSAQPASDGTPKRARLVFGPLLAFHPLSLYFVEVSFQKKKKKGKHKYLHVIPTEFYLGSLAACTSRSRSILKSLRWQRSLSAAPLCGQKPPGKRHGTSHTLPRNPPCRLRVLGAAPMSQRKETRSRVYTARHGENPRWQGRHVAFLQAFPAPRGRRGGLAPTRSPHTPLPIQLRFARKPRPRVRKAGHRSRAAQTFPNNYF